MTSLASTAYKAYTFIKFEIVILFVSELNHSLLLTCALKRSATYSKLRLAFLSHDKMAESVSTPVMHLLLLCIIY